MASITHKPQNGVIKVPRLTKQEIVEIFMKLKLYTKIPLFLVNQTQLLTSNRRMSAYWELENIRNSIRVLVHLNTDNISNI